jgi:hypothetical protein
MKAILAAGVAVALPALAAQPSRWTEKCNTEFSNYVTVVATPAVGEVARNPQQNPELYRHLWEPRAARENVLFGNHYVNLEYEESQDIAQIAEDIKADPLARLNGVVDAFKGGYGCFAVPYPSFVVPLTEYYNTVLDHYFLSSSPQENAAIDSGAAGPGWTRTGETLNAVEPSYCAGSTRVYRFYGPIARSHVFTPDPQECGNVRKPGTGWLYEGVAFGAFPAYNGACQPYQKTVWRLYNNRGAQGDSNHRYVARQSLVDEMTQRGWALEGVAFCVSP